MVLWRPTRPRTNTKKDFLFSIGDCDAKVGSQEIPGVTDKFGLGVQNEAGQRLTVFPRERTGHSKHPLPTTQEKTLHMDITRRSIPKSDWYILCSQRWRSSIQSAKTRPGDDCGSDHELLIAKFRLKLKKVGETTRLFRYDLNQIPYDYIVKVTNRFKGLDLTDCLKNYGWRFVTLYRRGWTKLSSRRRHAKRQNGCLKRPYK